MDDENKVKLGQYVTYVRVKPGKDNEPDALVHGAGNVVGKLIGINGRLNFMVKDGGQAFNLEPHCVNPDEKFAFDYFAHHQRIQDRVAEHKKVATEEVTRVNAILDNWDENMFGKKIVMEVPPEEAPPTETPEPKQPAESLH